MHYGSIASVLLLLTIANASPINAARTDTHGRSMAMRVSSTAGRSSDLPRRSDAFQDCKKLIIRESLDSAERINKIS